MKMDDYSKYYIQGSDHYLIPKDVFKELVNENEKSEKARIEAIKILKECLQLSPHEFDWEEQAENVINKLNIYKGE